MPDPDVSDVFLRNRTAVVEALFSDPALANAPDEAIESSEIAHVAEHDSPRGDPGHQQPANPGGRGPLASDQIHALLGGAPDAGPVGHHMGDRANRATSGDPHEPDDDPRGGEDRGVLATPTVPTRRPSGPLGKLSPTLRNPKVLAGIGVALAALMVLLLITTGGDDETTQPLVLPTLAPAVAPITNTTAAASGVGTAIKVSSVTSQCPAGSTAGIDAFSGETGKAWSCVRAYKLDGQVMTIELGKAYTIDSIGIVPGWDFIGADGTDEWTKHRTVTRISYEFADAKGTIYTQDTLDQRKLVVTKISPPVTTSTIIITILKSSGDRSLNDVAMSSVVITGK